MALPDDDRGLEMLRARLTKPLVLVGMMGAGKSRLGRMLADGLDLPFADSDDEIEKAAGCSIAEIFDRYGEPFFRDRERKVISRLIDKGRGIIATGGGAVMQPETLSAIHEKSISIWVRAELAIMVERTARHGNRPLLRDGDPAEILANLATVRNPYYETADIIVESHNGPAVAIMNNCLQKIGRFLQTGRKAKDRE